MSTKISIAYGDGYHIYSECFDEESVYLQLDGANLDFEVVPNRITVRIPKEIGEAILNNSQEIRKRLNQMAKQ